MRKVPELDYRVLSALAARETPIAIDALAAELGLDQAQVTAVCVTRAGAGEIAVEERVSRELRLGPKGRALGEAGLPDRRVAAALATLPGGRGTVAEIAATGQVDARTAGQALRFLVARGWAEKDGSALVLTQAGRDALAAGPAPDEALVALLAAEGKPLAEAEAAARGVDVDAALALLGPRKGVVDVRERVTRLVALTPAGRALVEAGIAPRKQINQLTPDLLRTGAWRDADLRRYDVTLAAEPVYPGKAHPLVRIFQQTRRVFLEMGFDEIESGYVESSFWDFDALFQPQDHPARDMQDTFYVGRPAHAELPERELVERVRRTHEDGGDTGSLGWRYRWDVALARRPVLRTHTTASTIRALHAHPEPPGKYFCVGPVFRRETVDYKHLPVFHQVDGIIVDEHASLATLLGTLRAFYAKMGFSRFQFRPAFFPYTEPSVEVFVWSEKKRDWVEMGGAGIFRPEVTRPLGCTSPVLAWGLGLERLAMFRYDLGSIGELYRARLAWLKETPLCR